MGSGAFGAVPGGVSPEIHEWLFAKSPEGVRVSTTDSFSGDPVEADRESMQAMLDAMEPTPQNAARATFPGDASLAGWLAHLKASAESGGLGSSGRIIPLGSARPAQNDRYWADNGSTSHPVAASPCAPTRQSPGALAGAARLDEDCCSSMVTSHRRTRDGQLRGHAVFAAPQPRSILVIVDERRTADEIALELRRKGHEVEVEELRGNPTRP